MWLLIVVGDMTGKNNIIFDFWACQRPLTKHWGSGQVLERLEKQFEKWTTRYCFICKQKMIHVGGFVWKCEHCDTLDTIQHIVLPYGRDEGKEKNKVELI